MLDVLQLAVGDDDVGGVGVVDGEAGDEHVAAGEQLFVVEGGVVVVVDEAAFGDLDVEEVPDTGWAEDALRGPADLAGIDEPAGTDSVLEGEQLGLRCGRRARRCARVSRRCRSALATTTARRPSSRVMSQAALSAAGTGTHRASGRVAAVSASAQVGSRCSRVAIR